MSKIIITKKRNDPLCQRASLGGTERMGFYLVYRGKLPEVIKMIETILEAAKKQAEQGEPPVEDN